MVKFFLTDKRILIGATVFLIGIICHAIGWHLAGWFLAVSVSVALAIYIMLVVRPALIPTNSVVLLRLSDALREVGVPPLVQRFMGRATPSLYEIFSILEFCAQDPNVQTVVVDIGSLELGFGSAYELGQALRRLADSGKHTIACLNSDSVGVREYLLSAGAQTIVINPNSTLAMVGVASGAFFIKRALDKLEIEAQTLQWKEYKGAAEIFTREQMSPALRHSAQSLIDDWEQILLDSVSQWRSLDRDRAWQVLRSGFLSASEAREAGLIDRVGHFEDIKNDLVKEEAQLIPANSYLKRVRYLTYLKGGVKIALIYGVGPIITGEVASGDFISGEEMAEALDRASRDRRVAAIVMRVNSPGGSAVASETIWRAVKAARERKKPVVVSMGDVAASGGYYIACAADAIVATPGTISGSIGVVYAKFNLGPFLKRLGIDFDFVKTTEVADALSIARALSDQELEQLNRVMGELYSNFIGRVSEGRRLDLARTEEIARGRVWSGIAAKGCGLIDEIGGLEVAIRLAREKAGIPPDRPYRHVVYYPPSWWFKMAAGFPPLPIRSFLANHLADRLGVTVGTCMRWTPALTHLLSQNTPLLLGPLF